MLVGIAVGAGVGLLALLAVVFLFVKKKRAANIPVA